ncbi:MAG: hypothetical protein PHW02_01765 [bacterium]|nr:hypothetical protein [bacterium]
MAKVMSALALLLAFFFINCSVDYDVLKRIGGDVSGFSLPDYAARFYSNADSDLVVQVRGDTIIDNQFYREIFFDFNPRYFLYSEQYIYERVEFDSVTAIVPFLNQIIIKDMKIHQSTDRDLYSYDYSFTVDSLSFFGEFENVYFITTSTVLQTMNKDTSFVNKYAVSHSAGIVGMANDSLFLALDSIVIY